MKRSLIIGLFVLAFAGVCATAMAEESATLAPDRVGRWDIGILGGGAFNDEAVDSTGFVQGGLSYGVHPWIGLGIEAGWQEAETDFAESSSTAGTEDLGQTWIMGDILIRVPIVHEALVPYMVIGLGGIWNYVGNEPLTTSNVNGDDADDSAFGWKIGGGLDWFITPNWVGTFEFAWFDTDVDLPGSSVVDGSDFWTVGGGIKYVF